MNCLNIVLLNLCSATHRSVALPVREPRAYKNVLRRKKDVGINPRRIMTHREARRVFHRDDPMVSKDLVLVIEYVVVQFLLVIVCLAGTWLM